MTVVTPTMPRGLTSLIRQKITLVDPTSTIAYTSRFYRVTSGTDITDSDIAECIQLFIEHFGRWEDSPNVDERLRGRPITMTSDEFKALFLSDENRPRTLLCRCFEGGTRRFLGYALMTTWDYGKETVGWVTQLVVHSAYRGRGIATKILSVLEGEPLMRAAQYFGVTSPNPATCSIVARVFCE